MKFNYSTTITIDTATASASATAITIATVTAPTTITNIYYLIKYSKHISINLYYFKQYFLQC